MPHPFEKFFPREHKDVSMFTLSGAMILTDDPNQRIMYNAGVKGTARLHEAQFENSAAGERQARDFVTDMVGKLPSTEVRLLEEGSLCDLGDALVTLASRLLVSRPELILFPLRGGYKLQLVLEGMLDDRSRFRSVPFSEAASVPNDEIYIDLLLQRIRQTNQERELFNMAVVDVGNGGDGTRKMRELLTLIHDRHYSRQRWAIQFNVFHHHNQPERFTQYERGCGPVIVAVETFQTNTDVLDDWVAVNGLKKVKKTLPGGTASIPEAIETIRPAGIIVRSRDGLRALVSPAGVHVGNRIISDVSTLALHSSPKHRRDPKSDRWK